MKRILILILIVFAAGCNAAKNAGGGSGTSIQGTWTADWESWFPGWTRYLQSGVGFKSLQRNDPSGYVLSARTRLLYR